MALTAPSPAIALSVGPPSHDTRDTSSDGTTVRGSDINWQTGYAAVRIAIETIKESSDLCLPLKAVAGAMSVLIKDFDVSKHSS